MLIRHFIIVNDIFINNNIVSDKYSYNYILENLDLLEVKELFYERYVRDKISDNERYFNSKKWLDDRYNILFKIELLEKLKVVFIKSGEEYNEKFNFSNEMLYLMRVLI